MFIIKNKILHMPNEYFKDIIQYYARLQKFKVLQHLIINLDYKNIDTSYVITICLE